MSKSTPTNTSPVPDTLPVSTEGRVSLAVIVAYFIDQFGDPVFLERRHRDLHDADPVRAAHHPRTAQRPELGEARPNDVRPQSLTFLPHRTSVPLLVNHCADREIGVVRELMRFEDTDGPWLVAVATVTDRPDWLKRGVRASFGYKLARYSSFDRTTSSGRATSPRCRC